MTLVHETTIINPTYNIGDVRIVNYNITFTVGQVVEPESGWFFLNGAAVSRTTYPLLYARYGTTFGAGNGSTTFNLPDYTEGTFPIGRGNTSFTTYAASAGEITHSLTSAELPTHSHTDTLVFAAQSHNHTGSLSANSGGSHSHTYTYNGPFLGAHGGGTVVLDGTSSATTSSSGGSHAHTVSISYDPFTETYPTKSGGILSTGSGTAHNNMMPYVVIGGLIVKHD